MRNNKRQVARKVLAELEQSFLQLAIGIALALLLVAWVLAVGEQPPLMFTILVAAIASGLISSPVDRIAQAFWRSFWPSSVEKLSNSTDALWEPDWPEAIEARRSIRQWRRHRRCVSVAASGLLWALIFGFITFLLAYPQDQWQHDTTRETVLIPLVLAVPMALIGLMVGTFIAYSRTSDWQR